MPTTEIIRTLTKNIEDARNRMEDGHLGFVFHTPDYSLFINNADGTLYLGKPQDACVVTTMAQAKAMCIYWNSRLTSDQINSGCGVIASLRREALTEYIEAQRSLIDLLTVQSCMVMS